MNSQLTEPSECSSWPVQVDLMIGFQLELTSFSFWSWSPRKDFEILKSVATVSDRIWRCCARKFSSRIVQTWNWYQITICNHFKWKVVPSVFWQHDWNKNFTLLFWIRPIYKISMLSIATPTHWEFRMSILKNMCGCRYWGHGYLVYGPYTIQYAAEKFLT